MKNNAYLLKVVKNNSKGIISLKKRPLKQNLILYSIKIRNNIKSLNIIKNEISIKDVLTTMLIKTNKLYDNIQYNINNLKLENDEYSIRSKIIKNIKDFISNNISLKNNKNHDYIFCNVIYLFDLLIIQNKKYKLLSTFEKLGIGALILVIKFNKLQEKVLIKKYKSILNDKYMTLKEINKIEILSLKLIEYNILQPNPAYYLDFLYNNIFIINNCKNTNYIAKLNISFLKSIMCFSNNYMKYHPFYLSCFIIKYCFEQNKIDGFQKTMFDLFDMNMRIFRNTYEEFLKNNTNQMKIAFIIEKQKKDENKSLLYKKADINSDIIKKLNSLERFKSINKININNSTLYKSCKKEKKLNFNYDVHSLVKPTINHMNNTYYKKYLENFLSQNSTEELSEIKNKNMKTLEIPETKIISKNKLNKNTIKVNKKNYTIESPKKCGILINYRFKKRIPEKSNHINNNKLMFVNFRKFKESINNTKNENKKDINKENVDKNDMNETYETKEDERNKENNKITEKKNNDEILNIEFQCYSHREHCCSIRKTYKNKNLLKNIEKTNNKCLASFNTSNIISVNLLNSYDKKEKCRNFNIKTYLDNNKNYKTFHEEKIIIDDSNLKSTINQSESSLSNNKGKKTENKRIHKVHIRNFYKQKNLILLNFSNSETKQIL